MKKNGCLVCCLLCVGHLLAGPEVVNGSFEAQQFRKFGGYVEINGPIEGWESVGKVGLNPWLKSGVETSEMANNGIAPDGKQVLFIQDGGGISQRVKGFESGKKYQIVFYANSRVTHIKEIPKLLVSVDGKILFDETPIPPAEGKGIFTKPYPKYVSKPFEAPSRDVAKIEFVMPKMQATAILLDAITIEEV